MKPLDRLEQLRVSQGILRFELTCDLYSKEDKHGSETVAAGDGAAAGDEQASSAALLAAASPWFHAFWESFALLHI